MAAELIQASAATYRGQQPIPRELFAAGEPTAEVWLSAQFSQVRELKTGVWVGQPGAINVPAYPSDEVFTVISGAIELAPANGPALRIGAGESCLIRRGWSGVWRTLEPTRKCYVTFDA